LLGRRAFPILLVAAAPVAIFAARCVYALVFGLNDSLADDDMAYAILYRTLLLRLTFFFGCMILFTALVRGEVLDRSLHYWFLSPVRRSVIAAGKFLAGVVTAVLVFGSATVVTWLLVYLAHGPAALADKLASGWGQLAAYAAASAMACIGYGAVFMAIGVFFKTPIVPGLAFLGWESINFLLPAFLKKLSVVHYVESFLPIGAPLGPLAVMADPVPVWLAVPGLLALAAVLVFLSAKRLERMEILYGAE
jgi:ABC-type transport system involved in multi-copper enzyme maturation permease subunit